MKRHIYSTITALLLSFSVSLAQTSVEAFPNQQARKSTYLTKDQFIAGQVSATEPSAEIGEKCLHSSYTETLKANDPLYRQGWERAREDSRRIAAEIASGERAAPPVYTIPIVFHVIHKGESIGTGTNISTAQIESTIDALNRDYRRNNSDGGIAQGAGPDTEIQFCLAGFDENGNPHSGINRVNGTGVSGYSSSGITSSNEVNVKSLSRWDNLYYLNVWVVSEIENNNADLSNPAQWTGGTLGYAYQPSSPVTFNAPRDGIVAVNLCVGNDPNQNQGFRLWPWGGLTNRTLTHEVGHYLGLDHTFLNSSSCADGDGFSDTPPARQFNPTSCNDDGVCNQQIENYMDYTGEECQDQFTAQQTSYMRSVLAGVRNAVTTTSNCGSFGGNDYDAGISAIVAPSGALCATTFTPIVTLYNYGTTTLTSVTIQYYVDAQTPQIFNWSGSLASNASTNVTLGSVTTTAGVHTFNANTVTNSINVSNTDADPSNNSSSTSFNAGSGGTGVTLTLDLDCFGEETTWEIRDANNGLVGSGGPYVNNTNGEQIVESFCLAQGCYDFTIFDSYDPPNGDGLHGSQWQSCSIDGDYEIVDENNAVLVEMTAVNGDFGAEATHNFCVGGGGNPPVTTCDELVAFDGEGFFVNATDLPNFDAQFIDNDQAALNANLAGAGYISNWMGFYESDTPGDTNFFVFATSWHANTTVAADNWITFGPVTMTSDGGEIRWQHLFPDTDNRDGYEVLVGTTGTDVADFNSATTLFSVGDNDASTVNDADWTDKSVALPAGSYAGQELYFAFHHNATDMFFLALDEIVVEGCETITVGVSENEQLDVQVYPNPSSQNFTIKLNSEMDQQVQFELVNSVGQIVWTRNASTQSNNAIEIETSNFASGVYSLMVKGENFNTYKRLVLTK